MNALWLRLLRSSYRREPIASFIVTVGAIDAVIGGIGSSWSLFGFGLSTVAVAVAIRLWQTQRIPVKDAETAPEYYLPPASSRPRMSQLSSRRYPPD
ncbi:MAG: hypothetical protein HC835_14785 [Oscillatoriales cyanobacterium RM2_1_1]|nr:hypothetical protein [Oscillatoriales cyanobacterium RM2_1_1]